MGIDLLSVEETERVLYNAVSFLCGIKQKELRGIC